MTDAYEEEKKAWTESDEYKELIRKSEEEHKKFQEESEAFFDKQYEGLDTGPSDQQSITYFIAGAIVLAVILSILAQFVGLGIKTIWAFVGGFVGVAIIEEALGKFTGIRFGAYSFFIAFSVGVFCAIQVSLRK